MANLTNSAKLIEEMEKKINATDVSKVGKSNKYSDLDGKPTIPTVNNSTITIQKNGSNVDSFTTNASAAKTINIQLAKADVGLGNVDNTSDANKPISNAAQTALNAKANSADVYTKAQVDSAITSAVSSVYKYKGSVANYSALASKTGMVTGDVWNTEDTNMNYAWTGTAWDPLGATVDLSGYVTTSTLNTELAKKQDSITSTNKLSADLIADGTTNKVVTSTEKTTWNNKQNALASQTVYSAKGSATKVPQITTNNLGQVTKIEEVTITQPDISNKQDKLVSGTNIKTVNGNSILGSGNLVIAAGDSATGISTTQPTSPVAGSMYYDTTAKTLKIYSGSVWEKVGNVVAMTQTEYDALDDDTKNDGKLRLLTDAEAITLVDDTAFGSSWDGDTNTAPSKNAVYDAIGNIEALLAAL